MPWNSKIWRKKTTKTIKIKKHYKNYIRGVKINPGETYSLETQRVEKKWQWKEKTTIQRKTTIKLDLGEGDENDHQHNKWHQNSEKNWLQLLSKKGV